MTRRIDRWPIASLALALVAGAGFADGGVPVASGTPSGHASTLLMRPAEARVGAVEFTLLGDLPEGVALCVQAPGETVAAVVPWSPASARGVRVVAVSFDEPGEWLVRVGPSPEAPMLEARIAVASPLPAWSERLPWLLAWVPLVLLAALRNGAISYTARRTRA